MTTYICNKPIATVYTNSDAKYAAGQALLGQLFAKIGESKRYYQVRVWGIEGWIAKENADEKVMEPSLFDRTVNSLNATVYEDSDIHSKHISMLYLGTKVHILKEAGNWSQIEVYGLKGWIYTYHLLVSNIAVQFLNTRAVPGYNSMEGMDSLGLAHMFLRAKGFEVPKSYKYISEMGQHIKINELQAGDILVFCHKDHLGIYEGEDKFIHTNEKEVIRDDLSLWKHAFVCARRFQNRLLSKLSLVEKIDDF